MLVFDQIRLVVVNLWTVGCVGSVDTLRPYAYDRILQLRAVARQAAVDLSGKVDITAATSEPLNIPSKAFEAAFCTYVVSS